MAVPLLLISLLTSAGLGSPAPLPRRTAGSQGPVNPIRQKWDAEISQGRFVLPPLPEMAIKPKGRNAPLGYGFWSVRGREFVDTFGRVVRFSGVVWSGFETPTALAHGLDRRSVTSHLDQMKELGFNLIRLPFAGETLKKSIYPTEYIHDTNADLQGKTSLQCMDRIVQEAWRRGIKIILCYHRLNLTIHNEWGAWWDNAAPEEYWIWNWVMLAQRYRNYDNVIGADLYNEVHPNTPTDNYPGSFPPDAPYWVYNAGANDKYNFRRANVRLINQVHRVNPHWIFHLEGMHNGYWWGGNCAALLRAPITHPKNKIAFTAHEYGPYVYDKMPHFVDPTFPRNLFATFRKFWGFIHERGIKPVWVGELGSFYPEKNNPRNTMESTVFEYLVAYIRQIKASWAVFQWTPNSKDTGGVLMDDWITPDQKKMRLLRTIMYPNFRP